MIGILEDKNSLSIETFFETLTSNLISASVSYFEQKQKDFSIE